MNKDLLRKLDYLISGTDSGPAAVLARKPDVSPRYVKYTIKVMREEYHGSIEFDKV